MFWGLTIEPGKHYTQTVEESFHVSMAALETRDHVTESSGERTGVVQVIIKHEKTEFLVCSLFFGTVFQQPLDLNFTEGEEITFFTEGRGTVHLTGYLVKDEPLDMDPDDMMSLEDASSSEDVSVSEGDEEDDDDGDDGDDADMSLQQLALAELDDEDSEDEEDWSPTVKGGGYPPGKKVKRKKPKCSEESAEKESPIKRKRDINWALMYQPPTRKSAKKARKTMAIAMAAKQDAAKESNDEDDDGNPEKINQGLMGGIDLADDDDDDYVPGKKRAKGDKPDGNTENKTKTKEKDSAEIIDVDDNDDDTPDKKRSMRTRPEIQEIEIDSDDGNDKNVPGKKQSKSKKHKEQDMEVDDEDEDEDEDEDDEDYVPGKKQTKNDEVEDDDDDDDEDDDDEDEDDDDEDDDEDDDDDDDDEEYVPGKEKTKGKGQEITIDDSEENDSDEDYTPDVPNGHKKDKNRKKKQKNKTDSDKSHTNSEKEHTNKEQQKKKKQDKTGDNKENVSSDKVKDASPEKESPRKDKKKKLQRQILKGGVKIQDTAAGHGAVAKYGKVVQVYYKGRLQSNNRQFDACMSGSPFSFRLGKGEVIKGWDTGVAGMKVGGKRQIIVPPSQGYGNQRTGPIPPNSTLIFEVELKNVR